MNPRAILDFLCSFGLWKSMIFRTLQVPEQSADIHLYCWITAAALHDAADIREKKKHGSSGWPQQEVDANFRSPTIKNHVMCLHSSHYLGNGALNRSSSDVS